MKYSIEVAFALAVLAGEAQAFWDKGHLLVARRAEMILAAEAPKVLEDALFALGQLRTNQPDLITSEGNHAFTECAVYGDEIKDTYGDFQYNWHFIDSVYLDEPGTTIDDFDFTINDYDSVGALTDLHLFLRGQTNETESKYVA